MAPIEHVRVNDNLFIGQLNQQNVTIMNKNDLYDLYNNHTKINSVPDYSDKQIIDQFEYKNDTRYKHSISKISSINNSSASSFLSQYFAFMSYFVGKL